MMLVQLAAWQLGMAIKRVSEGAPELAALWIDRAVSTLIGDDNSPSGPHRDAQVSQQDAGEA